MYISCLQLNPHVTFVTMELMTKLDISASNGIYWFLLKVGVDILLKKLRIFSRKQRNFQKQTNTWNTFLNVLKKESRSGPLFGDDDGSRNIFLISFSGHFSEIYQQILETNLLVCFWTKNLDVKVLCSLNINRSRI